MFYEIDCFSAIRRSVPERQYDDLQQRFFSVRIACFSSTAYHGYFIFNLLILVMAGTLRTFRKGLHTVVPAFLTK